MTGLCLNADALFNTPLSVGVCEEVCESVGVSVCTSLRSGVPPTCGVFPDVGVCVCVCVCVHLL